MDYVEHTSRLAVAWVLDFLAQLAALTLTEAYVLTFALAAILGMVTIHVWVRRTRFNRLTQTMIYCGMPVAVLLGLASLDAFRGATDGKCHHYGGGHEQFRLLKYFRMPAVASDPYGNEWLILVVQSAKRWSEEPHLCRISMAEPKAEALWAEIQALSLRTGVNDSSGNYMFSFGSSGEMPNVRFVPDNPADNEKREPPEKAPPKQDA